VGAKTSFDLTQPISNHSKHGRHGGGSAVAVMLVVVLRELCNTAIVLVVVQVGTLGVKRVADLKNALKLFLLHLSSL
jgi:hypothetical protein